jgi:hypothetical protein
MQNVCLPCIALSIKWISFISRIFDKESGVHQKHKDTNAVNGYKRCCFFPQKRDHVVKQIFVQPQLNELSSSLATFTHALHMSAVYTMTTVPPD